MIEQCFLLVEETPHLKALEAHLSHARLVLVLPRAALSHRLEPLPTRPGAYEWCGKWRSLRVSGSVPLFPTLAELYHELTLEERVPLCLTRAPPREARHAPAPPRATTLWNAVPPSSHPLMGGWGVADRTNVVGALRVE